MKRRCSGPKPDGDSLRNMRSRARVAPPSELTSIATSGTRGVPHGVAMPAPRARPTRPLRGRRCSSGSDAGLADRTGASSPRATTMPEGRRARGRPAPRASVPVGSGPGAAGTWKPEKLRPGAAGGTKVTRGEIVRACPWRRFDSWTCQIALRVRPVALRPAQSMQKRRRDPNARLHRPSRPPCSSA